MADQQLQGWLAFAEAYEDDAEAFVREVFEVEPFDDQLEIIDAYNRRDRRIAKRSGHGPGKTTSLAWIILHHAIFRFPQKTVCTAPTKDQLYEALMAETTKWYHKLPPELQVFEIKADSFVHKSRPKQSFISFRTSSADNPEALAGIHEDWVLLIVDEASGVAEKVYESAAGSMSGKNAITILTGNPTRRAGTFFDVFHKTDMMAMWTRLHVSSEGHPNVDPDFLRQIETQHGRDSNQYRVRVLGEFPIIDDDTVIPWKWLEDAMKRDIEPTRVRPIWGLDVARKGRDASALSKRQGNVLLEPIQIRRGRDTMETAGWIKHEWDTTLPSLRPSSINIDLIGIGAGVLDRLRELKLPVRGINVSESASSNDKFDRLRSELWWKGRTFFERKDARLHGKGWTWDKGLELWVPHPNKPWKDEFLAAELALPTFDYTSAGKIAMEAKKVTMKRTGQPSPNRADAFLLTFASEAISLSGTIREPDSWNEPIRREIKGIV